VIPQPKRPKNINKSSQKQKTNKTDYRRIPSKRKIQTIKSEKEKGLP
jgi:hypothetical protein